MQQTAIRIAVVGAGPAGLALALHAAHLLPAARITVFDARPAERDVSGDPRTLALSLGSVQLLQRVQAWPGDRAEPILEVQVSQAPPSLPQAWGEGEVRISAAEQGVPLLGAVLSYGTLVAALQQAWLAAVAAEPARLACHFGTAVQALVPLSAAVEVQAGDVDRYDLVVVAEGGVFSDQSRRAVTHDYRQTAWVGTVTLEGAPRGTAFERFTRQGPLALLPLPAGPDGQHRAAMVWCVHADDDPVLGLDDEQRRCVVDTLLPAAAGRVAAIGPLKHFALGLNAERTLVDGRIVRIGNAAQTLHPVAGQGLNLGLRDAYALVDALRFADRVESALRRVEWARAPDRWATIATVDFLARSFTWDWPGLALLRGAGMAALQRTPAVKRVLAQQMMFGRR
jgi:2-octaprenyl-6-methoxyphenol hydroxylase